MKHLKLYEEFDSNYFSQNYEELTYEEFTKWREGWLQGYKFLQWSDQYEMHEFISEIRHLLKSYIGEDSSVSPEFVHTPGSQIVTLKAVVCLCEETGVRLVILPFDFDGVGFMVTIFGPETYSRDKFLRMLWFKSSTRDYKNAMGYYLCYEGDTTLGTLDELLKDKQSEGLFTTTPKPYKTEPILKDEDFTERGITNQKRAQFYKEQGKTIRDFTREEALKVLDEWTQGK